MAILKDGKTCAAIDGVEVANEGYVGQVKVEIVVFVVKHDVNCRAANVIGSTSTCVIVGRKRRPNDRYRGVTITGVLKC